MTRVLFAATLLCLAACGSSGNDSGPPRKTIELIARDSLDGWLVPDNWINGGGPVEVIDGELIIGAGSPMNGVKIDESAITLPDGPYEIELEARRVEGQDIFLGLTFPVPERSACVTFVAGGWGGRVTGISSINFRDASQNSTTSTQSYETGRWYRFHIEARPDILQVRMDDRLIAHANIKGRIVGMRPGEVEQVQPFGLITWNTKAAIRNITIRELPAWSGG